MHTWTRLRFLHLTCIRSYVTFCSHSVSPIWQGYPLNLYIHVQYDRLRCEDSFQNAYIQHNRIPGIQKRGWVSLTLSRSNYWNGFPDFHDELGCESRRWILRSSSHSSCIFAFTFNFWKFQSNGGTNWHSGRPGSERYFIPLGGHFLTSSFLRLRKSFETGRPFPVCTNCWLTSPLSADKLWLPVDCSASSKWYLRVCVRSWMFHCILWVSTRELVIRIMDLMVCSIWRRKRRRHQTRNFPHSGIVVCKTASIMSHSWSRCHWTQWRWSWVVEIRLVGHRVWRFEEAWNRGQLMKPMVWRVGEQADLAMTIMGVYPKAGAWHTMTRARPHGVAGLFVAFVQCLFSAHGVTSSVSYEFLSSFHMNAKNICGCSIQDEFLLNWIARDRVGCSRILWEELP